MKTRSIPTAYIDQVNQLNVILLGLAWLMAWLYPFELFIGVYIFLGPLHYLTEISWLQDRGNFIYGKIGVWWLWTLVTAITLVMLSIVVVPFSNSALVMSAFFSAVVFVSCSKPYYQVVGVLLAILLSTVASRMEFNRYLFGIWVPTLIHVFVFTWIFMFRGAQKTRSRWGFFAWGTMTVLGISFFIIPISGLPPLLAPRIQESMRATGQIHLVLSKLFGWDVTGPRPVRAMQFIAFAYTFHYWNWFSKTELIGWNRINKKRWLAIGAAYGASVGVYLYNFQFGLAALLILSLGHVVLEFPLNIISIFSGEGSLPWLSKTEAVSKVKKAA